MSKKWAAVFLISAGAILAAFEAWVITRPGIGISPDSIVYMACARSIAAGEGFSMPAANGQEVPLTHFPPGYPMALALLACLFKRNLFLTARALNIGFFGLNTALLAAWIYRRTGRLSITAFSIVASLTTLDFLRIYAMAWSEPLFLFLTFSALFLLDCFVSGAGFSLLITAAALSAAAVLTRYAGLASLGAGLGILWFCQNKPPLHKLKDIGFFSAIAGSPLALWLLRNVFLTHDATTRKFVFHPVWGQMRHAAQSTLSLWLFQDRLPLVWTLPVGALVILGGGILWRRYKSPLTGASSFRVPALYAGSYIVLIGLIAFFLEAQLLVPNEYDRILWPLHLAFLLTFLLAYASCAWPTVWRYAFSLAALSLGIFFVQTAVATMQELSQEGQQFANVLWRTSPTIDYVRQLPRSLHVYTNGRMPIYLYVQRPCYEFPPKTLLSTLQPYKEYPRIMAAIVQEVRHKKAVVIGFTIEDLPQFPSRAEWETLLQKKPQATADGYIFD